MTKQNWGNAGPVSDSWRCCGTWRKSAGMWQRPAATTGSAGSATTAGCDATRPAAWRV